MHIEKCGMFINFMMMGACCVAVQQYGFNISSNCCFLQGSGGIRFLPGSVMVLFLEIHLSFPSPRYLFLVRQTLSGNSDDLVDSDDDDTLKSYLEKVEDGCASEYQSVDESELDRQLTLLGIGTDNASLFSSLIDVEKKSFTLYYNRLLEQETGLGRSVFTKKQEQK